MVPFARSHGRAAHVVGIEASTGNGGVTNAARVLERLARRAHHGRRMPVSVHPDNPQCVMSPRLLWGEGEDRVVGTRRVVGGLDNSCAVYLGRGWRLCRSALLEIILRQTPHQTQSVNHISPPSSPSPAVMGTNTARTLSDSQPTTTR